MSQGQSPRRLPDADFLSGPSAAPLSEATLVDKTVSVCSIYISSIDDTDQQTLTIKNGDGTTIIKRSVQPLEVVAPIEYRDGLDFLNGIKISCTAASKIVVQIYGRRKLPTS